MDSEDDSDWIAKINAIIRFHYQVDPEDLSDQRWSQLFNEYVFVQSQNFNNLETVIKNAVFAVAEVIFPKTD